MFYFYLYITTEKCNFLSIVISFIRNISLLTLLTYFNTGMYFEGVWSRLSTRDGGMPWSSIFFDDAMQIGFFELFYERVRNGNFSCSSKPPNKAHPPKQALRPARLFKINVIKLFLGVSFDQGYGDWLFFWKMKILMCCKVTPWNNAILPGF